MRNTLLLMAVLFAMSSASATHAQGAKQAPLPPETVSGSDTYHQACASCHGDNGKGFGFKARDLKTSPPDLTTLAKRNGGKFPYDYVSSVLLAGVKMPEHGAPDMPVWGPIFKFIDKDNKQAVLRRIQDLSDYLASIQQK